MRWSLEPASSGSGAWLVGRGETETHVIAAPGTPIATAERDRTWQAEPRIAGWRLATWVHEPHEVLNIDRDPPVRGPAVLRTEEILLLVDVRLHASIRELLEQQLGCLETMNPLPGLAQHPDFEKAAHLEVAALAWIRYELANCFPNEHGHLREPDALLRTRHECPTREPLPVDMPRTVADIEMAIPKYTKELGGRELARLLKRRVIWRILERAPLSVVVVLYSFTNEGSELHELVERHLKCWRLSERWPTRVRAISGLRERLSMVLSLRWPSITQRLRRPSIAQSPREEAAPRVLVGGHSERP